MTQRLAYLDNLKVLLVVGVIAVHTAVTTVVPDRSAPR
jgi:surface polysaccharide O-acyltransferase-like enzyme